MRSAIPLVVFSDLDGTLLDHDTYSWSPAKPALVRLAHLRVPVILASSKTASEIDRIQTDMNLSAYPAIVENGAGVIGLSGTASQEVEYTRLRATLARVPARLRSMFTGFGDMSVKTVSDVTGLSCEAAKRAMAREFSEPGIWVGTETHKAEFITELEKIGVAARLGGRFMTLSFGRTKKDGMVQIIKKYTPRATIALGDAPNDIEMLEHADYGVIIANPHHASLPPLVGENMGRIERTQAPGPEGWNLAVNAFLDRYAVVKEGNTIG